MAGEGGEELKIKTNPIVNLPKESQKIEKQRVIEKGLKKITGEWEKTIPPEKRKSGKAEATPPEKKPQ